MLGVMPASAKPMARSLRLGSAGRHRARGDPGRLTDGLPAVGPAKAGGEGGIDLLRSGLRPKPPPPRLFALISPPQSLRVCRRRPAAFRHFALCKMAERVGFEPTVPCGTPDFESGTIDHSVTSPGRGAEIAKTPRQMKAEKRLPASRPDVAPTRPHAEPAGA